MKTDKRNRSILEMSCDEARAFLMKQESYCGFDLPPYFNFNALLGGVNKVLSGKKLSTFYKVSPRNFDGVNHVILNNKDGRHGWRPLQLIHPALYVSLVNKITENENWRLILERFRDFSKDPQIKCLSLPVESLSEEKDKAEQVSQWWQSVEQTSIELALDYEFIIQTDVVDCYSSIYTHSIAWAIHTKPVAKANRSKDLLIGNVIDSHIQDMRQGQTNGIPQGSVLMDFISEMVLGYAGMELTEKLSNQKVSDYRILRYRDDYRIFTNNSQDGEKVLKCLTEVMIELGLKLSPAKTKVSNQVVRSSIKDDKRSWMCRKQEDKSLQKHLLIIHNHSVEHPNAGSLVVSLGEFHKQIVNFKKLDQPMPLISIVVDIAYHNPRVYSICVAVLSKLLSFIAPLKERPAVVNKIIKKFSQLPNTGHLELWLQRICISFDRQMKFGEPLCLLICGGAEKIWNSDWISLPDLKNAVDPKLIVDEIAIENLDAIISPKEVALFIAKGEYSSQ